jgi:hypothetical protein
MSRGLPPAVLSPTRVDLFRHTFGEPRAAVRPGATPDLSVTVTIQDRPSAHGRRFAFHTVRRSDQTGDRTPDHEQQIERTFLITDERPDANAVLDHADVHSSAPFLAGAIAQARPSPVLHNPPYREAAGAYRRSDGLGLSGSRLGFRSDEKV